MALVMASCVRLAGGEEEEGWRRAGPFVLLLVRLGFVAWRPLLQHVRRSTGPTPGPPSVPGEDASRRDLMREGGHYLVVDFFMFRGRRLVADEAP